MWSFCRILRIAVVIIGVMAPGAPAQEQPVAGANTPGPDRQAPPGPGRLDGDAAGRFADRWVDGRNALLITRMADLAVTVHCLGAGICRETNPMLAWADEQPIAFAIVIGTTALATDWALGRLRHEHPKAARIVAWSLTGAYSALLVRNVNLVRRQRAMGAAR